MLPRSHHFYSIPGLPLVTMGHQFCLVSSLCGEHLRVHKPNLWNGSESFLGLRHSSDFS